MKQNEVYIETSRLFESTSMHGIGFGMPARRFPSFGVMIINMRSGEFDRRSDINEPLGDFGESDMDQARSVIKAIKGNKAWYVFF